MSGNGPSGDSVDVGHESGSASLSKENILKLKCPQWFSSGKYLDAPNPGFSNENLPAFADMDGPKRRGRPPKAGSHQPARQSARAKASTNTKPVATRSSKRKLAGVNGEPDDQDIELADVGANAALDITGRHQANQGHLEGSRDPSGETSVEDDTLSPSNSDLKVYGTIDGARQSALQNGRFASKKPSPNGTNESATSPTARSAAHLNLSNLKQVPMTSIESHIHLEEDDDDDEPSGMITRAIARSKSAVPNLTTLRGGEAASALNVEDLSAMDETEQASAPGTPKAKGRGRWPNGPLKARAAAAGVSTATFKKSLGKKKGAPGKRKTSDNAVEQATYDRQAQLRQHFKELRKMYLKSLVSYLDRQQKELKENPDAYKESPQYAETIGFLEKQRTAVVANREKEEQLERQLLERRFEGDVSNAYDICSNKIKDLKAKFIMKAQRAYMDIAQQWVEDKDEELTDNEDGEYELSKLDKFVDEQEAMTEVPTAEDNEPLKKGRVPKPKRGKKRAGDEPLVQQIAKRHAPAMLSATTHPEEESEADKRDSTTPSAVPAGPRGKNKYHFDEHGVHVPTEAKKGPQREEPNNRVVIEPWFEFEKHEIGLRNLYDELHEVKPKAQLPTGYWHVDPHRGVYNISNKEEDYDKKLVEIFGVHPKMGLPGRGCRNPDGVFPPTDYERVLKNQAPPLRYVDEEHRETVSVSKSWDIIQTAREYEQFERRMRSEILFGPLKEEHGQQGLATFDAIASDYINGIRAVDNMLEAAESLERETPKPVARTVSPSPGTRQSARQKARAEALAAKARPATPITPPSPPPPPPPIITSTQNLSFLADAAQIVQMYLHMQSPSPPRHVSTHSYQRSPPAQRTQSQLPHISFINNPMPPADLRPLAPQPPPQQAPHHPSQPFLQPRPQPMEMQRQYQGPGMMAPPSLQPRMPLPYPSMHGPQPHPPPPSLFYGSHQSPPQPPGPPQRPNLRPGPGSGLRSLLPRTMPGEPPGPPGQHHHVNHQQGGFYNPGPPPPPQHMGPGHERFYDGPSQHISPYRNEPYPPYTPGPPGPPPGYGPFRHHSPRR